jgi:hypothetical protein
LEALLEEKATFLGSVAKGHTGIFIPRVRKVNLSTINENNMGDRKYLSALR